MANEDKKDFNAMLHKDTGMPKVQIVTDEATIKKYGGEMMYFAPPIAYDEVMKTVPCGKVITVGAIRDYFAQKRHCKIRAEEVRVCDEYYFGEQNCRNS